MTGRVQILDDTVINNNGAAAISAFYSLPPNTKPSYLYILTPKNEVKLVDDKFEFCNGVAFSKDGKKLFVVDFKKNLIWGYKFCPKTNNVGMYIRNMSHKQVEFCSYRVICSAIYRRNVLVCSLYLLYLMRIVIRLHVHCMISYKDCTIVTTRFDITDRERHLSSCDQSTCIL